MEVVWSNNQISMLIELYQHRNFLWDPSNKDYKDKLKKNDAWADIAAELHVSQKEVETKMHILRSQFSREKKKIKTSKRTGSGSEAVIKSKWQWYEPLQFLLCGATTSGTSDTMGTDGSGSIEPSNSLLSVPLPPSTSLLPAPTPPPSQQPPPPSPPHSQSNKRKYENSLNEAYEIMRSAKKKMEEPKDEFEIYGQYVASELKNVKNQRTVLQAKYYINKLLQARIGNFDINYFGGFHGGSGWQGSGDGFRTTSSTSTFTDASTPTHTPEHQTGIHTATGDELHFSNIEEIVSQLEDDTQQLNDVI